MKKILCLCILFSLLTIFSGCSTHHDKTETITVVTTVFPEYDWTREIIGDGSDVQLILLTKNGTDLHSYQPTVTDVAAIASCDLLIYTGGVSSSWIDDVLKENPSENRTVIRLMDDLSEDEKLIEQSVHHNTDHHHDEVYDEHIWLSLRLASRFCDTICAALCDLVPEKQDAYRENCAVYIQKLQALDATYQDTVAAATISSLLFADRFPFTYFANDYNLTCYAAFPGCSAETEASFETVSFLIKTVEDLDLPAIVVLENSDRKLAETVLSTTKTEATEIVKMNALQSVSGTDLKNGISYLEIMHQNLAALRIALGCKE